MDKRVVGLLLLILFFAACGKKAYFEENKAIPGAVWKWEEPVSFNVPIEDTVSGFNFVLNLRTTKSYEYSNIYMFVNLKFPDGSMMRDTVEYILADDAGKWFGTVSGGLVDNHILFAVNRIFPMKGTYEFSIEQAMRMSALNEVEDVGIRIDKIKH